VSCPLKKKLFSALWAASIYIKVSFYEEICFYMGVGPEIRFVAHGRVVPLSWLHGGHVIEPKCIRQRAHFARSFAAHAAPRCKLFMHQPQSIKRHFLSFIIARQQQRWRSKENLFYVERAAAPPTLL